MDIIQVTNRSDRRRFIEFPHDVYRGDSQWVPSLRADVALTMRRRHPFYDHSDAAFFIARQGQEVVGRIAVIENRRWNDFQGQRDAHFYWFDVVDDAAVTAGLMDRASAWAADRSLDRLLGPKGFLPTDGLGVLVEGFEHAPALGVPYNHPYYGEHLEAAGFEKATDYLSGVLDDPGVVPNQVFEAADAVADAVGYRPRTFRSRRELRRWVPRIGEAYNTIFFDNWEYSPLSRREMKLIGRRFIPIADPKMMTMLMLGEEIVGHILILPDVSAAIRRTDGRLFPFGWWQILREPRRARVVDFLGMGLVPEHRGQAANLVMYAEIARRAPEFDYDRADLVQLEEGNLRILRNVGVFQVRFHKRHRVFERAI